MPGQLGFPPHEGLPWEERPPTVDGYVEPDPGIPIKQLEAGYTHGSRHTFADSSGAAASGAATTAFQGIKDNARDLLYLAWIVRFDFSFDENDRIVCCVRPAAGSLGGERRIDIQPLFTGGGANPAPADPNDITPTGPADTTTVRTNRPPRFTPAFYRETGGSDPVWQELPQTGPNAVANADVRVRSAIIEGSGSASTARYWSVELQLPTRASGGTHPGGPSWIDLDTSFGLYFNVIRVCGDPATCSGLSVLGDEFCAQFAWPNPGHLIVDPPKGGTENWTIPDGYFGEGIIVPPGGPNPARGVRFRNGIDGVGVRSGGPGSAIGHEVDMSLGHTNTIVARVFNDDTAPANGVFAEFRLADFGIGPYGNAALWGKIDVHGPGNPTPPQNVAADSAADVDLTADWTINNNDRTKYGALWDDQCLWTLLDSAAGATFAESSVRRNLRLIDLSTNESSMTVSGKGHGQPAEGRPEHDFMLHVVDVKYLQREERRQHRETDPREIDERGAVRDERGDDERLIPEELNLESVTTGEIVAPGDEHVTWLHVVNGYRRTGKVLTLGDKRTFAIWTHAGTCAFVPTHELQGQPWEDAVLGWRFEGGGIRKRAEGFYYLPVPEDGEVKLTVLHESDRAVKPGDATTPIDDSPIHDEEGRPEKFPEGCLTILRDLWRKLTGRK